MATSPFDSLDDFVALPRIEALALSPDGRRAVLTAATLSGDKTAYERSLWQIPVKGDAPPVRSTRSAKGETGAVFTASGDVLFVSARADVEAADDAEQAQLWRLPAAGGEARPVTRLAGGVTEVVVAESGDHDTTAGHPRRPRIVAARGRGARAGGAGEAGDGARGQRRAPSSSASRKLGLFPRHDS